ncbi:MAG: imidazolonepropionase [Euryarchaeota archaeon]
MGLLLLNCGPVATLSDGDINLPLIGQQMSDIESQTIDGNNGILMSADSIEKISQSEELSHEYGFEDTQSMKIFDCKGKAIIPGFVDSHTHLLWDGDRANEMQLRHSGLSYSEIAKSGGGIQKTVQFTRKASFERLTNLGLKRIERAFSHGTTTMECKSGYGLSLESEIRLLQSTQFLSETTPMEIHSTWLGAHDVPKDMEINDYVDLLIHEQLPAVVEQGIASYADVFCEPGWFSLEHTELIVNAAEDFGLPARIHVDEFVDGGGLQLASELGVVSGDHVGHSSDSARQEASEAGVMQTFLPGTPYILGNKLESPLKKCVENDWAFSLATDFNPNCRTLYIPFVGSLATHRLCLSPLEALASVTRNPASTLTKSVNGELPGSIREGGPADIVILDSVYIESWCQMPGDNPIFKTVKSGKFVN